MVEKETTGTTIGEDRVYKLKFLSEGDDGATREWTTKRHKFEDSADDGEEVILYDPDLPQTVLFMDVLPFALSVRKAGIWVNVGASGLIRPLFNRLVLPASILGTGYAIGLL